MMNKCADTLIFVKERQVFNAPVKRLFIFLLFIMFCIGSYCQYNGYRFENITSEQGIEDRYVHAIILDEKGFIWIGSEDGLTKFDGYSSVVYHYKNDDANSLADNEIYSLCTDDEGFLWIGTHNGLSRLDIKNNKFENFFYDSNNPNSLSSNEVFGLAKDLNGNIWIATYGGGVNKAEKIYTSKKPLQYSFQFRHYRHNEKDSNSLSSDQAFAVCFDKKGNAWMATAAGLNLYDLSEKKFTRFYHQPTNTNSIANSSVYKIFAANDAVWVCGKRMLDKINLQTNNHTSLFSVKHYLPSIAENENLSNWDINGFIMDKEGNGWVATNDQGLIKFYTDENGDISYHEKFVRNEFSPYNIAGYNCYSLNEDKSGVIWIGTEKGISKYIPSKSRFNEAGFENNAQLNLNISALIMDDKNRLWAGYDSDTLLIIEKKGKQNVVQKIKLPGAAKDISDQVNVMYKSFDGDIYIGTMRQGMFVLSNLNKNIYDKKNWLHFTPDKFSQLPSTNIYSFAEDNNGIIWIGTYKGLCRYDPETKQLDSVFTSPGGKAVSGYIIRALCADENNFLWCGTDDGLYLLNNGKLVHAFKNNHSDLSSLNNNRVNSIMIDRNKNIWVCTEAGINLFNREKNNFKRFGAAGNFPQEAIKILQQDEHNNLWMGTNHGLIKYNLKENKLYKYGVADGLCAGDFQANANCADADGIFYFGTGKGIVSFNPKTIKPNNFIPPVVITNIKILDRDIFSFDDTLLTDAYRRENKLQLKYNQNFFSFEFAALNYINTPQNKYAYMLEGIDPQWNNAGTQRFARYADIKPGHYTFKVKASNNDGVWNNVPATVAVIIAAPWWQTWWFYFLCCVFICAAVYTIYRIRVKQILKLYKLRSSIAKDLHDDVGSALSSIALLSRIAQEGKTNAKLQPDAIFSRIGDTSKRMIDLMDDIVWSVNPDNDRFSNMLVRMREYAAEMLEAKNINFSFKIAENISDLKIPMQMRKDYFLIFKEAINNLAKYSCATNAFISIQCIKGNIITIVADNGKGFNLHNANSGNGLKNMQHRAAVLKGKLQIQTDAGKGTGITLIIPVT